MKLVDRLKEDLVGNLFVDEEIDCVMEECKYYPIECETDDASSILKYSNNRSQIWVKCIRECNSYLVEDITISTKRSGKTKVRAFRTVEEIKGMMDWFRDNKRYDDFLIFMLGLFLARRIGDTLSLKWSDFYYENGRKKESLNTLIEQKTGKMVDISITDITWKYIDWYCDMTNTKPMQHFHDDVFQSK